MKIYKKIGIIYSEYFLELLNRRNDYNELRCSVESFNNCRENGLILKIYKEDASSKYEGLTLYIYNNRISDKPSMTYELEERYEPLYSEDAWINRTLTTESVEELIKKAEKLIKERFYE